MPDKAAAATRRSISCLLGMTVLMFGANFAWVSYNSILLLPLVQKVVPADRSSIAVGVIAFVANLAGIGVSLLVGILSDHSTSRLGKRTPGILIGVLVGLPVIACAAIFPFSLPIIIGSYLGMHLFTNVANGAWWPLQVEAVPEGQRGLASGLQGFYMLLASAVGFVLMTYSTRSTGRIWPCSSWLRSSLSRDCCATGESTSPRRSRRSSGFEMP